MFKFQKVSQEKKQKIFQELMNIKILLKIFTKKLFKMKQNMVQLCMRIYYVCKELDEISFSFFQKFHI